MPNQREEATLKIEKEALLKQLNIDAVSMYDNVINPILNAGMEHMTYDQKVLKMIESADIIPNEEAFLVVMGVEHLFKMMADEEAKGDGDGMQG